MKTTLPLILIAVQLTAVPFLALASELTPVGFASRDISPKQPLRLSGFGARTEESTGVRDPLFVRAMAIGNGKELCVMVSIESIAVLASQTQQLLEAINQRHSLARSRLVLCSTHSHTAPQVAGGLTNLFRILPSDKQKATLQEYRDFVHEQCLAAVFEAIAERKPSKLSVGLGEAGFAAHRRVVTDGTWTGFGVSPDGPTDRRVRVLVVRNENDQVSGAVFQYACHCTTLGPAFNEVTGDWAGIAAAELEELHKGATFLPIIGCGADANPEPRDSYEIAQQHGQEMAQAVNSVVNSKTLQAIDSAPEAKFGYAGISAELPSKEELNALTEDADVNRARWAREMLDTWNAEGILPESYPAPIHTWTFGDQLAWVFLGGEVVVQYQMRLEEEVEEFDQVWVAAYTDDVFAYVAAENMRSAGGYEVDYSMVYYSQPGRWESGTEDLIIRRVHEILDAPGQEEGAKSPEESLKCMHAPEGFQIELVANEPLIVDPVNMAFAGDGSVWVVEMGDYPLGKNGGCVKRLTDTDHNGQLDASEVFLDGLEFPTSVLPWRDGAIVIAAPDIFFARDTDGDGKADERKVLLTGVGHANPQHRASGFDWGLDGMVYFGSGYSKTLGPPGEEGTAVGGVDLRWNPDTGELQRLPGATQFVRSRDRWGRWFGNSNSVPLFHFPIDEYDMLSRNPSVPRTQLVLQPGVAPPVYPRSRTVDRFNDMFAENRFTSACSSIVLRSDLLGNDMQDAALVCEPVHNLVARFKLTEDGPFLASERFAEDQPFEFFTSTDTWSRPVRAIEAPDGSLWIVDMYRKVIEHPEWIPEVWQERLNLRSGENAGRIYRISKKDSGAWRAVDLQARKTEELVDTLASPNATLRDLACQQLLWRAPSDLRQQVLPLFQSDDAAIRLQTFGLLCAAECDQAQDWQQILQDPQPLVVAWAIRLASRGNETAEAALLEYSRNTHAEHPAVQLGLLVALGNSNSDTANEPISQLVAKRGGAAWAQDAISLASSEKAPFVMRSLLGWLENRESIDSREWQDLQRCIESLWRSCDAPSRVELSRPLSKLTGELTKTQWMLMLVAARVGVPDSDRAALEEAAKQVREQMTDKAVPLDLRLRATQLLGSSLLPASQQLADLRTMLKPDQPGKIREAALAAAYRIETEETASVLLAAWNELVPAERSTAGATLLQRRSWTVQLVEALEQGDITISDLDASTLGGLQNYEAYDVMKRLGTLIAKPDPRQREELVHRYTEQIGKRNGEATDGQQLFKQHCAACHQKGIDGSAQLASIGPPISNLKKWSTGQWVTAVLDPNATVEAKYKQYKVLTKSGQVLSGVVQEQSDLNLKLGLSDGKTITIARADVEKLSDSRVSLMPEGFESKLSPQDLSAVIKFLRAE
ncbi:MAG: neutral/alkaline non-lysosomal ceramidase N-terminal domain-containing protein [Planctomycetota bacterium]